jgi:hypothetical protein
VTSLVRRVSIAALGATVACNAILDIEPATLDTGERSAALTCDYPQDDPVTSCPVEPACESCLETEAPGITGNCISAPAAGATKSCRAALVEYRLCIGDDCTDQNGQCADCVSGSAMADQLREAVRACPACRTSAIALVCEAYCACMPEKCPVDAPADCFATCMALSPYKQYCRWQHCERATMPDSPHCTHAIGGEGACNEDGAPGAICEGIWDGLGCEEDKPEECCSGSCRGGICSPN